MVEPAGMQQRQAKKGKHRSDVDSRKQSKFLTCVKREEEELRQGLQQLSARFSQRPQKPDGGFLMTKVGKKKKKNFKVNELLIFVYFFPLRHLENS